MEYTTEIMVPIAYEGEGDSTKVLLSKTVKLSVPLVVGMEFVDETLTIQGTKRAKLIVDEVKYYLETHQCAAVMKKVTIQPKFIRKKVWQISPISEI